jgi:hypothetical protein
MTTRTFFDLPDYLPTPFLASFQIEDHPALPITLGTIQGVIPTVATHGKAFRSLEHLFFHYNKYNAGYKLDFNNYVTHRNSQQLLQYITFQEGPYNQLSVAKTLELTPAEWADLPALVPIDSIPVSEAQNAIQEQESQEDAEPIVSRKRQLMAYAGQIRHRITEIHELLNTLESLI